MKMDLRMKILSGYFAIILLLTIVGYMGFNASQDAKKEFELIHTEVIPKLGLVNEIKAGIAGQANDERGFLVTGDDEFAKGTLDKAEKTKQILDESVLILDDEDKEMLNKIDVIFDQFTEINKQVIAAYNSGNIAEARRLSFEVGREKRKQLDPIYLQLTEDINNDVKEAQKRLDDVLVTNLYLTIGVVLGSVLVSLGLGFYLARKIVTPIKSIVENSKMVAEGDFSIDEIAVNTKDECSDLAESFNTMVRNVKALIQQISVSTDEVASTSQQLSANSEQVSKVVQQVTVAIQEVAKGAADQSSYVNNTFETVGHVNTTIQQISAGAKEQANSIGVTAQMVSQMANSIQEVAVSAQTVSNTAEKTKEAADKGENAVALTMKGMESIKDKVFESANKIKELGEHSQHIGEIIQVIDDIAEQTNLLALNAAIEAARAGEHGKGFAVVADEVRKLAERSGKATKEIENLIINIQNLTAGAVQAMEQGTSEVEQGSSLAFDAGNALKEILSTVEQTYQQVQNISAAAEEISASSQEVVKAIDNVSAITEENSTASQQLNSASSQVATAMESVASITEETTASAEEVSASSEEMTASIEEMSAASKNLADMADNLNMIIGKFKLYEITDNCWDVVNCKLEYRQKCPAFESKEKRCWLIEGTWCGGTMQGDAKSKRKRCMNCQAFKKMTRLN